MYTPDSVLTLSAFSDFIPAPVKSTSWAVHVCTFITAEFEIYTWWIFRRKFPTSRRFYGICRQSKTVRGDYFLSRRDWVGGLIFFGFRAGSCQPYFNTSFTVNPAGLAEWTFNSSDGTATAFIIIPTQLLRIIPSGIQMLAFKVSI